MRSCRRGTAAICARTARRFSLPLRDLVHVERRQSAMDHIFTVIAPGAMGSAVARRMHQRGATVRTSLAGRSAASIRRAAEAGMSAVESDRDLVEGVDIVLSIVPPGEAVGLAERLLPLLAAASRKPLVIDC